MLTYYCHPFQTNDIHKTINTEMQRNSKDSLSFSIINQKKKSRNLEDMKARQIMLKSQINFNNRKKKGNAKWKKSSIRKMSPKRKVTRANPRCI